MQHTLACLPLTFSHAWCCVCRRWATAARGAPMGSAARAAPGACKRISTPSTVSHTSCPAALESFFSSAACFGVPPLFPLPIPLLSLTRLCASNPATRVDSEKKYRVCEMAWLSSLQSYTGACAGCCAFVIGSIARRLPCVRQSMASTEPWPTPTIGTSCPPDEWLAMASIEPCLRVFLQGSLPLWMADTAGV
jgi:hypothetical protein